MKKQTRKRLWLSAAAVLGFLIVLALFGWTMLHGTPDWYQPLAMSAEQREAAAQRATNKLALVQNEAARLRAAERGRRDATTTQTTQPAARPGLITVSFTDDEINAFFNKWSAWQNLKASYERFLSEPCIVLQDGRLILAGRLQEIDAVASVHFEPQIDSQGRLNLKLTRILGGKLPLPEAIFTSYHQKAATAVSRRMGVWRRQAAIDAAGVANSGAISAAMGDLLINVLNQQPAEPTLFLPLLERGSIPVKLAAVKIEDHSMTLTVQPMTADERVALLQRIRAGSPAAGPAR